jgi:hypothetical protein
MSRSVTFNGVTLFKPGGITKINAEALNQVVPSANSIVGLMGEADGGAPGSDSGLVTLFDPSRATSMFRDGPLTDAIRLAFQSSNDPLVPGGASRVLVYKTNQSTQAELSLPSNTADLEVSSTATSGSTTTVVDTSLGTTYPDDAFNGMHLVLRPFTGTAEVRTITDYVASTNTITVAPAFASGAVVTNTYRIYENEVEDMDVVSGTTTTLVLQDVDVVDDQHNGRWAYIQDTSAVAYLRRITDTIGSSDTLNITPALPAAPSTGAFVQILPNALDLTSKDWGAHTNGIVVDISEGSSSAFKVVTVTFEGAEEISPDLGGKVQLKVLYKGGATSISDTVAAAPASTSTVINLTTGGLTVSAHVGTQVLIDGTGPTGGEYTRITANTASTITVSPALSFTPTNPMTVEIRTVTAGVMEVAGSAGAATSLTTTITGVVGDNLSKPFTSGETLRQLADDIEQNSNYEVAFGQGVNPDTTLAASLDFGADTEARILASTNIATEGLKRDLAAVVEYFNEFSSYVSAERSSDTGSSHAGCCPPRDTTDPGVPMAGGTRGISANSDFQDGMDALLMVRCNSVVPLIDEDLTNEGNSSTATVASVAAQLADHVTQARGASQNNAGERGGFVGFQGTKTELIEFANDLNDFDVAVCAQNPTVLNASGSLEEMGPRMLAVMAASMRAGVSEVALPLTNKLIRCAGLTQDSSWDPADLTDANELIQNGILFAESIDGVGTKWVRDLTTWVADDNLAFSEGSVRDAVRFVAHELRSTLVRRYTGLKAAPATVSNMRDTATTVMENLRQDNIIVDSTDPATGATIRAYHNLKITTSGDTARINVGIFPVPGINFQLTEIFLQLPTQSS